jgi:hypothetical protein
VDVQPGVVPTTSPRRTLLTALLLVLPTAVISVAASTPASADDEFSQLEPPPLCSAPHTGACVAQPHPDRGVDEPILVDMPTMTRDSTSTGSGSPTGYVTFTITQPAGHPGYVARPPSWITSNAFAMIPIPGYSETGADQIFISPDGSCEGRWTCTYKTTDTSMQPGWYWAFNINGDLVGQDMCPPDSPNFVAGCFWTSSQSAFYVPKVGDIGEPIVRSEVEASGHTVNAIAAARDPEGQAMSLTWDWGDGTITPGTLGAVATHTYADVADFTVTARVLTTDGRNAAWSQPAGIVPPPPVLQSVSRVGATSNGVASGLLQEWPAGTKTLVYGWTNGCPSNPANSLNAADAFFASGVWATVQDDGTFSRSLNNLQPAPAGYAVLAQSYVEVDGQTYLVKSVSNCTTTVGAVATTSGATPIGEDEVPVDSSSVPIGHVAVIDAGTSDAEQRLVTGHGSLILESGLSKAHPAGAQVVDAGVPVAPYVEPAPPPNPAAPALPAGDGSTVTPPTPPPTPTTKLAPGAPTVAKTTAKPGQKVKVKLKPGSDGGSAITGYEVTCSAKGGAKTRTATGAKPKLTVTKLTKGKKYKCKGRATNAIGTSPWSKAGKKVLIPARSSLRRSRVVSTT